jgi:very-short-patch-repair endonuclease
MSCLEQPAYEGKTFGIISLLGEEQAFKIEKLLRSVLSPSVFTSRRLLCGNAAQFQGDERDVIFLSMVDSADNGPLSMRDDDRFRKRFNVAASRAKDQMWLVHSLNHDTDLKKGDLRRRLIEHALNPTAGSSKLPQAERSADSEFEREVIRRLASARYQVQSQKRVGYFKIDILVEGGGKRLAVECDGDRYHTLDNLADDMERQATLERLGWRFVRVRGSEFFRDPDQAMAAVFERLERLGVAKVSGSPQDVGPSSSLVQDVIKRAEYIRASWERENGESLSVDVAALLQRSQP